MYQSRGVAADRLEYIRINDIECLSTVLESEREVERARSSWAPIGVTKIYAPYNPVVRAMLLYFDRVVKLGDFYSAPGELSRIEGPFAHPSHPTWTASSSPMKYREPLRVGTEDLNGFKEYLAKYESFVPRPDFLSSAIHRFHSASRMMFHFDTLDSQIVDYVIGMEALLADGEEIAQKLATRMAILLGGSADQRHDTYDFVKYVYKWRSNVVHGRRAELMHSDIREGRGWPTACITGVPWIEIIGMLHWYCRLTVKRIFDLTLAIRSDEQLFQDWKTIGTSRPRKNPTSIHKSARSKDTGEWLKQKIIDLLDYSLIRSDLADSLQQYYAGSTSLDALTNEYKKTVLKPYLSEQKVLSSNPSLYSEGFDDR